MLVVFGLQLCLIVHKNCRGSWSLVLMIVGDTSNHNSHFLRKSFSPLSEKNNYFTWRHEVFPLNSFSCLRFNNLRSHNFHMTLVNMKFNILARSWEIQKIQIIWQNTKDKNMYQIQEVVKCYLFLIFNRFLWTHPFRPKPIIKKPFMF